MVISLFEDISHWQVISDGSVFLCGRDFSDRNISPADGPSQKKKRLCTEYIIPAVSQAACLGHILGSSVVTDTSKNSFDKEEIRHWLNRMLNYAAETKQALTGMTSEAPTKHILNVKAIPTSHWEFLLENLYLQTVMDQGYRQQGRRLRQRQGKEKKQKSQWRRKLGTEKERARTFIRNGCGGRGKERCHGEPAWWKVKDREREALWWPLWLMVSQ